MRPPLQLPNPLSAVQAASATPSAGDTPATPPAAAHLPISVIYKQGNLFIPWEKVRKYAFNPKAQLIGLDFEGPEWTSPAVMQTFDLVQIARVLRDKAPDKDMSADIQVG